MLLETPRLGLRRLTQEDFPALCRTLQDPVTMTAYEGAFSVGEGAGVLEIGYLFQRDRWHRGYATEAARACKAYAFDILGAAEVSSIIRGTNLPSQRVALRNGMTPRDTMVKHYRGVEMPHTRYAVSRTE